MIYGNRLGVLFQFHDGRLFPLENEPRKSIGGTRASTIGGPCDDDIWSECCLGTKSPAARSGGADQDIARARAAVGEARCGARDQDSRSARSCCRSLRERSCSPKARNGGGGAGAGAWADASTRAD